MFILLNLYYEVRTKILSSNLKVVIKEIVLVVDTSACKGMCT